MEEVTKRLSFASRFNRGVFVGQGTSNLLLSLKNPVNYSSWQGLVKFPVVSSLSPGIWFCKVFPGRLPHSPAYTKYHTLTAKEGTVKRIRLGVNIDHVATIRQARRTFEPDPVHAAIIADLAGADQITLHLREDRRHIQDRDLKLIRKVIHSRVNLEMAATDEMVDIAINVKPDQVTLVPEKREEITTEGGLDVSGQKERLSQVIKRLKENGITVNLFIDPEEEQVRASKDVGADAVELHTGEYANARSEEEKRREVERLRRAARLAKGIGLKVYAGHGLTYKNVEDVARIPEIEELNIGHSIVANAVLKGLSEAVREMKEIIERCSPAE